MFAACRWRTYFVHNTHCEKYDSNNYCYVLNYSTNASKTVIDDRDLIGSI